jgi:hypothetical protein
MEKIKIFNARFNFISLDSNLALAEEKLNSLFTEWQEKNKPTIIGRKFSVISSYNEWADIFLTIIYK